MTFVEKFKRAQSETKFKTDVSNTRMYYYGTEEEASDFIKELENVCGQKEAVA